MEQARQTSVEPQSRFTLPEVSWEDLNEPGAYVERGSGDLYRVPKEALIPGASPIIHKESLGASRLVQLSKRKLDRGSHEASCVLFVATSRRHAFD